MGLSQSELEAIQARWGLRFPPDVLELLQQRPPLLRGPGSIDWLHDPDSAIQGRLDWPFDGFWFDVKCNEVWWPEWGEKPATPCEQRERLKEIFRRAPKLIPLLGHRYIPQEPFERGNPVFSVYQTDIICYGADLQDWMKRERGSYDTTPWPPIKEIPFWSEAVRRNNEPPPFPFRLDER
jgi:hypothetical protein